MAIKIRNAGNISIMDIDGSIDINSSDIIETVGWLVSNDRLMILCNLKDVSMLDYSGLSILAIAYKNIINHKGRMKFFNVALPIRQLFNLVRLDVIFEVYPDEDSAISSFSETSKIDTLNLRRKFKRLDIHIRVNYKTSSQHNEKKTFSGDVLNLSASGLFIYSQHTFPLNTQLELELKLPGEIKDAVIPSRVIWEADKELQPHSYPGMGVAFSRINQKTEKMILDFIDKNITQRAEE